MNRAQRRAAERRGRGAARELREGNRAGPGSRPKPPSLDLLGLSTLLPPERFNAPTVEPPPEVFEIRGVEDL